MTRDRAWNPIRWSLRAWPLVIAIALIAPGAPGAPGQRTFTATATNVVAEEFSPVAPAQPCSAYTWTGTRNGEGPWTGCSVAITFTSTGPRTININQPQRQ